MIYLMMYWFKIQAGKAARDVLSKKYDKKEVQQILKLYWSRYQDLKKEAPHQPTLGGRLMIRLAALSMAFYQELLSKGHSEEEATRLFYSIAWKVYRKMGMITWRVAGWSKKDSYERLKKATVLFRQFPFNSPSYLWEDVESVDGTVAFNCTKCPVASYFNDKGLSEFCVKTWCAFDFPLAMEWGAHLERSGSIAGGAQVCDFRWKGTPQIAAA